MTVDEAARHRLFNKLEEVLGPQEAGTLMTSLPTYDLEGVATKADIDGLRSATKADIDGLRNATQAEFALVRAEMRALNNELLAGIRQEMHLLITSQTRTLMFTLIGVALSITSLAFFR